MPVERRRLDISDRDVWNSIMEMIQGDPVKALVEFITNVDDSYARLEEKGRPVDGFIGVEIEERRKGVNSVLRVRDFAEGFSPQDIGKKFGGMGYDVSGLADGADVRGFFGNGLKEGVLGLRVGGSIISVRDGVEVSARLYWSEKREPIYQRDSEPRKVTAERRKELKLRGNGTILEVEIDPAIRVPRPDTLVRQLNLHFALRDIVTNPARRVRVVRLGTTRRTDELHYREPMRDPEFDPVIVERSIPGYRGSKLKVEVYRATEPLTEGANTAQRPGGLLVQSRRALIACSMFGHENRAGTERLFGRVVCDDLYKRLREGDIVVAKNRTGLNRENAFVQAMVKEVDDILAPIVESEAKRLSETAVDPETPEEKKRIENTVEELNKIMREELEDEGDVGDDEGKSPFRFQSKMYSFWENEERAIRLLAKVDALDGATEAEVTISGEGLRLTGPSRLPIDPDEADNGLVVLETRAIGQVITGEGHLHATCGSLTADAEIAVQPRVEPGADFAFESDCYRPLVSAWSDVRLRIRSTLLPRGPEEVTFQVEQGEVQVRPESDIADPGMAHDGWVFLRMQVFGDRIGSEDVLVARMGHLEARASLVVSAQRKPTPPRRGGVIREIRRNLEPNPAQRSKLRHDGILEIFVCEPSIKRYLYKQEDYLSNVGRALTADIVLYAFCKHVAKRKAEELGLNAMAGFQDPFETVTSLADQLIKKYGARVHAAWNRRQ